MMTYNSYLQPRALISRIQTQSRRGVEEAVGPGGGTIKECLINCLNNCLFVHCRRFLLKQIKILVLKLVACRTEHFFLLFNILDKLGHFGLLCDILVELGHIGLLWNILMKSGHFWFIIGHYYRIKTLCFVMEHFNKIGTLWFSQGCLQTELKHCKFHLCLHS